MDTLQTSLKEVIQKALTMSLLKEIPHKVYQDVRGYLVGELMKIYLNHKSDEALEALDEVFELLMKE